jgi:hypothetical protein
VSASRFHIKKADLASIFPAVAGPAIGGFAGRAIGGKYPAVGAELGALLGGVGGGVGGQLIKEQVESNSDIPPGAPYAVDSTSADIPRWALQGAQMLQPHMKQGSAMDWVLGEVPGGNVVQRGMSGGIGQAGRAFAGSALGGVPGALLGLGVGHGVQKLIGHGNINVPGINIPLPELLAGLGGTIGATKGLQHLAPEPGH